MWLGQKMKPPQQPSGRCENRAILCALVVYARECIGGKNPNQVSSTRNGVEDFLRRSARLDQRYLLRGEDEGVIVYGWVLCCPISGRCT